MQGSNQDANAYRQQVLDHPPDPQPSAQAHRQQWHQLYWAAPQHLAEPQVAQKPPSVVALRAQGASAKAAAQQRCLVRLGLAWLGCPGTGVAVWAV